MQKQTMLRKSLKEDFENISFLTSVSETKIPFKSSFIENISSDSVQANLELGLIYNFSDNLDFFFRDYKSKLENNMLKRDLYYESIPTKSLRDDVRYLGNTLGKDLKSRKVLGMHWGTFVLSLEPIMEPPIRFKHNAEKYGFKKEDAIIFKIGEFQSLKSLGI